MMKRRTLLTAAASVAAAPAMARKARGVPAPHNFPDGFVWGLASSAPQTETVQGRASSIWDVFAAQPGKIKDGSRPDRGTEWDIRYADDLTMLANAGLKAMRFSVAWPRVQPAGFGPANPDGLDLYDRIVDAMMERMIEPYCTLFHWDLPAALYGGWLNRDTAGRFADYCQIVARRLGDRVKRFIVLNEPGVVATLGHALGQHAPGLASLDAFAAATHHQNLAQGLGAAAIRAATPTDRQVGTSFSLQPCVPADPSPESRQAAIAFDAAWNRNFLDPLFGHPYPAPFANAINKLVFSNDLRTIAFAPDFLGVNYYSRMHMRAAPGSVLGATWGSPPPRTPLTALEWPIEPSGLEDQLRELRDHYGNPPIYITENGAAFPDRKIDGGVMPDPDRIAFLRAHLIYLQRAIDEGCQVKGYFGWTLTDNWEWAEGYGPHFGTVSVDRNTMARTPRGSLLWLGRCAKDNIVL